MARAITGTTTPAARPDILNPNQDRYHDTNPDAAAIIGDLTEPARANPNAHLAHAGDTATEVTLRRW